MLLVAESMWTVIITLTLLLNDFVHWPILLRTIKIVGDIFGQPYFTSSISQLFGKMLEVGFT